MIDYSLRIRKMRDNNNQVPADFFEKINEWALESIAYIALDTRLGLINNPEAAAINQVFN